MKPHTETHITSSAPLRDFVIGLSDGLTVPFALAAGLAGVVNSGALIITAGLAEIAAGAIAMGLGGYLGAKTEAQHYDSEYRREEREVKHVPHVEEREVADILTEFGVPEAQLQPVVHAICQQPKKWVEFMMRFELGLEKPNPKRLYQSPLIIGFAYVAGGLIPLVPYMMEPDIQRALANSVVVTLLALFGFGAFKGHFTGQKRLKSGLQTTAIGSAAGGAAYLIAGLIS